MPAQPPQPAGRPVPQIPGFDNAAFAAAPDHQQKQMLGEALYPRIQKLHPELAGKITGMLLEMENMELLTLIDDDAALQQKVTEALSVYDDYVKNKDGASDEQGGDSARLTDVVAAANGDEQKEGGEKA